MTAPSTFKRRPIRRPLVAGISINWRPIDGEGWSGYVCGQWVGAVHERGGEWLAEHRLTLTAHGDNLWSRHATAKGARQAIRLRLSRFLAAFGI